MIPINWSYVLPVRSQNDPVPLVNSQLQDVLGHAHVVLLELLLGRGKVLLQLLDQLQPLPDVGLDATVVEWAGNYLFFRVLFQREGHVTEFVCTSAVLDK